MEQKIIADEKRQQEEPSTLGDRILIDLILDKLASGISYEEIMKELSIEKEDLLAILDFTSQHFKNSRTFC